MFGIIVVIISFGIIMLLVTLRNNTKLVNNLTNIFCVIYLLMYYLGFALPDGLFSLKKELANVEYKTFDLFIRSLSGIVPISIFMINYRKSQKMNNVAVMLGFPCLLICLCFYRSFFDYYFINTGKGILLSKNFGTSFKAMTLTPIFRYVYEGIKYILAIVVFGKNIFIDKKHFNFKSLRNWLYLILDGVLLFILFIPVYVPELTFGKYIPLTSKLFGLGHLIWFILTIIITVIISILYKKRSTEEKFSIITIICLAGFIQYNSRTLTYLNIVNLPFQPCNMGTFVLLLLAITRKKQYFNILFIFNSMGALFAIIGHNIPYGSFSSLDSINYMIEHSAIVAVATLTLRFELFTPITKRSLNSVLKFYGVYYVLTLFFNVVCNASGLSNVNFFFLMDPQVVIIRLPILKFCFNLNFRLGVTTIYPFLFAFIGLGYIVIMNFMLFIANRFNKRHELKIDEHDETINEKINCLSYEFESL